MTDHPSPKGESAMTSPENLREAVTDLLLNAGCGDSNECEAIADAILSLPALSVPEGWVAVPREVVEPFARAADWEERCIDPDYGIARVRPLKDSRRVAVTLGECRAVRAALSAIPSPGGEGSSRGLADQPSASRSLNSSAHAPGEGAAE